MEVDATIQDELSENDGDCGTAMRLAVSDDEDDGGSNGGGCRMVDTSAMMARANRANGGASDTSSGGTSGKRKLHNDLQHLTREEGDKLYGFDEKTGKPTYGPVDSTTGCLSESNAVAVATNVKSEEVPVKKSRPSEETVDNILQVSSSTSPSTQTSTAASNSPVGAPTVTPVATPVAPPKLKPTKEELYRKPFAFGWKREVVYRANPDLSKDKADVYFISPSGKKMRSKTEITPLLEGDLTIEHFCFTKEPLGLGSEFEIVRSAKLTHRSTAEVLNNSSTTSSGKRVSKPKAPKGASPPPQGWTPTRALKNSSSLNANSNSNTIGSTSSASPKATPKTSKNRKNNSSEASAENETGPNDRSKRQYSSNSHKKNASASAATSTNAAAAVAQSSSSGAATQSSSPGQLQYSTRLADSSSAVSTTSLSFASNFFANVAVGYGAILHILKYLKIHERPRAASVCKIWNLVAKDRSLWQTVRMKNSKVSNWAGFTAALRRGETRHLDLRKLLVSSTKLEETWSEFCKYIGTVASLEHIDMCRCSAQVVQNLFLTNPNLTILSALAINDDSLNLMNIDNLVMLQELRLRTLDKCTLEGDLTPLRSLKNLKHLTLSSVRQLGTKAIEVLGELNSLVSLELGECNDFDSRFTDSVLPKLSNLERLRLEIGQEQCRTLDILDSVAKLESLSQLEFVNFDIKPGFDDKLAQCTNIRKLLIIPTYISQSATTNNIVLNAVLKLQDTLNVFTWGVTVELLRVTALYVDQCEDSTRKERRHFDECIPVLKPVPGSVVAEPTDEDATPPANAVPQIEILPLDKVEEILRDNLATTKFTIVKVPYHATWKQQLVE